MFSWRFAPLAVISSFRSVLDDACDIARNSEPRVRNRVRDLEFQRYYKFAEE